MKTKKLIAVIMAVTVSTTSVAEDKKNDKTGLYLGALIGSSAVTVEHASGGPWNDSANAFGTYGGYNFNENFGVEGVVAFSNNYKANSISEADASSSFALTMTPKYTYHLNRQVALLAKVGIAFVAYKEEYPNSIWFERGLEETWTGLAIAFGLGAEFSVVAGLKFRLGYDYMSGALENDEESFWFSYPSLPDIDIKQTFVTAGMQYQF